MQGDTCQITNTIVFPIGCRIAGPSLAASLGPLAHRRNVASLSLFYRYYFGRCSSELAQLVPLPFFFPNETLANF